MTNATGRWTVSLGGMLLCFAAGCSGGAADSAQTPEPSVQLNEVGFISVTESADDPGYCGYRDLGVDADGNRAVEQERYYYDVINRQLAENADLQSAAGLSAVSTCSDARRFVKIKNEYRAANPESSLIKDQLLANFPRLPAEPPKHDPLAPVEKILKGEETTVPEMIGFGYSIKGNYEQCSAVRLSGVIFLTAAHCLSLAKRPASLNDAISLETAWVKHWDPTDPDPGKGVDYESEPARCTHLKKKEYCRTLQMDALIDPNYTGNGDGESDVAVLRVRYEFQKYIRKEANAAEAFGTDVAYISTVSPKVGDTIRVAGWGPNGDFDKNNPSDSYFQRVTAQIPINAVQIFPVAETNGVYNGGWISTTAQLKSQLCQGDSGGPWFDPLGSVQGLSSNVPIADPTQTFRRCAQIGTDQFAARVDYEVLAFIPQALVRLQKGTEADPCTCAFFPSGQDPTGNDHEMDGAHVRCNVGCEDPAAWVQ